MNISDTSVLIDKSSLVEFSNVLAQNQKLDGYSLINSIEESKDDIKNYKIEKIFQDIKPIDEAFLEEFYKRYFHVNDDCHKVQFEKLGIDVFTPNALEKSTLIVRTNLQLEFARDFFGGIPNQPDSWRSLYINSKIKKEEEFLAFVQKNIDRLEYSTLAQDTINKMEYTIDKERTNIFEDFKNILDCKSINCHSYLPLLFIEVINNSKNPTELFDQIYH